MRKNLVIISVIVLVAAGVWFVTSESRESENSSVVPTPTPTPTIVAADVIDLNVVKDQVITSPLTITGKAKGNWYFEASFPVKLVDANGNILTSAPAQAQGEWMTENYVPFKAILNFAKPTTTTGTLIFHNDNPSGLPEKDKEFKLNIKF